MIWPSNVKSRVCQLHTHTKQRLSLAERHRQYVFPQPMRKMCWSKNTGKSWQIRCVMKKWIFLIHRTDFGNPVFAWRVFRNCWLASREHEADQHKTRSAWWLSAVSYFQSAALPSQAFFLDSLAPHSFSYFMREFWWKMPRRKIKQNSRGRLCASLRSRNAHGRVTRAILCNFL